MMSALRRIVSAAILTFCVMGAAANAAQAATALDHACCHRAPVESSAAPDSPCDGFMPLTCCRAAALPGGDHASVQPPTAIALLDATRFVAPAPVAAMPPASAVLSPRSAATRLSVVLLV
jgi:hypothetical protein